MRWLGLSAILFLGGLLSQPKAGNEEPTYITDIAPVFAKKCTPCHTEGGPGPFPLETHKQVQSRGALIRYVLLQGKMPPAGGESEFGLLKSIHALTDRELQDLQAWLRAGSPLGSGRLPEPTLLKEWTLGTPDLVLKGGQEAKVKAEGAPYSLEIRVPLPESVNGRKVRAIEFHPKSGRSWRRAIIARAYPAKEKKAVYSTTGLPSSRILASWGLGGLPWQLPKGVGATLKSEDELAIIPLWQPSGKEETGEFEVGLYFDDSASAEPEWQTLGKVDFVIPPQDGFTDLHATTTLADDVEIYSLLPEARRYARLIRVTATSPAGRESVLFMVRNWDYEWAGSYNFHRPVQLPKGTRLDVTFTYDNSGHALGEIRSSAQPIRFGPGLDDELFWFHFQFRRL